jgi:WhiB family transcriptional regulator, redox-sensing transcriptional regulator
MTTSIVGRDARDAAEVDGNVDGMSLLSQLPTQGSRECDPSATRWQQFALCRGHDADLWFPTATDDDARAIAICRACPVRLDCLGWAIWYNERYGIWGGVSARGRQRMRDEMGRAQMQKAT